MPISAPITGLTTYPTTVSGLQGIAFPIKWAPVWFNQSQKTVSGASIDIGLASTPLVTFEIFYNFMRQDTLGQTAIELQKLLTLFRQVSGTVGRFLFNNFLEDIACVNNQIATGDGVTTSYLITSQLTGGAVVPMQNFTPKINGVDISSTATITGSPGAYFLNSSGPAPLNATVTVDMPLYGYYAKFVDPTLPVEQFLWQRFSVPSVKLESCRAGA